MVRSRKVDDFLSPILTPVPGHSRAVLGGVRDHLVSRRRVSHLLHHGDDHVAGITFQVLGALRAMSKIS